MKKVLFLHTHLGSGYKHLLQELNKHPRIQCFDGFGPFEHPDDLTRLTNQKHKLNNVAAIYCHPILMNHEWVPKAIRESAKNVFLFALPDKSIQQQDQWLDYYAFRLRGLYDMQRQTENKAIIWDVDYTALNEYLNVDVKPQANRDILFEAAGKYDEYITLMKFA